MMLSDRVRTEAYERAIAAVVRPGDRVLDFGCGTGILSFFAARCGASRVYAMDRSPLIRAAQAIARRNGFENVVFIHGDGGELALPEPVDVIVSEWMGSFAFEEAMLPALLAARDRHLRPGGTMLPSAVSLHAMLVTDPGVVEEMNFFRHAPYGVDFGPVSDWLFHHCVRRLIAPAQLAPGVAQLGRIEMATCPGIPAVLEGEHTVARPTTVYAVCGWFAAELGPGVVLDTGPHAPATHWKQSVFPLREPFTVEPGRPVRVRIEPIPRVHENRTYWRWSLTQGERTLEMDDLAHDQWLQRPLKAGVVA